MKKSYEQFVERAVCAFVSVAALSLVFMIFAAPLYEEMSPGLRQTYVYALIVNAIVVQLFCLSSWRQVAGWALVDVVFLVFVYTMSVYV